MCSSNAQFISLQVGSKKVLSLKHQIAFLLMVLLLCRKVIGKWLNKNIPSGRQEMKLATARNKRKGSKISDIGVY